MDIALFLEAARTSIFKKCIIFQISWFSYVFPNIGRVFKWIHFAGCSLDLAL